MLCGSAICILLGFFRFPYKKCLAITMSFGSWSVSVVEGSKRESQLKSN